MPRPDIDTDFIEQLAELLQRTGLSEIEIAQADVRIRVARQAQALEYLAAPQPAAPAAALAAAAAVDEPAAAGTLFSPMVGTAYLTPEPGSPPFVQPGDAVREGQTLLIIEAMKVMNAIRAPKGGRIARVMVENAAPVEYGEPLMVIE